MAPEKGLAEHISFTGESIKEFTEFLGKSPERGFTDFSTKKQFCNRFATNLRLIVHIGT